jgi:diguanylate cyclase (GGDEF)-like protein
MAVDKEHKRLLDILEAARTVVSQMDLDRVLAIILKKAMEITKTRAGSIALYTAKTETMRIHACRGMSKGFIANYEWKIKQGGLTDRILKARTSTVVTNTAGKSFFAGKPPAAHEGIRSLVCAPLFFSSEVVGVLYLDDIAPRKFLPDDLQALDILASFAAIAIHNARTRSSLTHQANTDSLTGLFNRRSFENVLDREFQRADRHSHEFSLALVDVNDFKKFNDTHGHQAGDRALAALGEAIRKAVRSTDFAARYGGDEIVIILPETKLQKAYNLFSKRIKQEIEEGFSRITGGEFALAVTIGIASYPRDGRNAGDLVLAADRALLTAKKMKYTTSIGCARPVAA